jgi:putative ABC transport system substrate-binding protein
MMATYARAGIPEDRPGDRMKRRRLLFAAGALAVAPFGRAQGERVRRVGGLRRLVYFGVLPPDDSRVRRNLERFREELRKHGFNQGTDYVLEYLWERDVERLPEKMRALVAQKVDLLVAITTPVALAAAGATREVPIVFGVVSDPVGSGLVEALNRPGGNVTGVTNVLPELSGKLLELTREIVPGAKRIAVMWNPDNPAKVLELREFQAAARRTGVGLEEHPVRSAGEIESALAAVSRSRVAALVTLAETLTDAHRERIAQAALSSRIPTVFNHTPHVRAGGLLSYSLDYSVLARRLGDLAGRILAGAHPSALPVEQPTRFELAVNLKTARALGIAIPQSVLVRADEVIQ